MPNYDYHCEACQLVTVEFHKIGERPESIPCPMCLTNQAAYTIAAPNLMQASYPDGIKRKGFAEMREANKLLREATVSKRDTAKEIRQEIKKMGIKNE